MVIAATPTGAAAAASSPSKRPWFLRWLDRGIVLVALATALMVSAAIALCVGVPLWFAGGWLWDLTRANPNSDYELVRLVAGGEVVSVAFSKDGKYLAAATRGSNEPRIADLGSDLVLWEISNLKEIGRVNSDQPIVAIDFSHDGKGIMVASSLVDARSTKMVKANEDSKGMVRVFDVPDLRERDSRPFAVPIGHARYSPDGKMIGVNQVWPPKRSPRTKHAYGRGELVFLDAESLKIVQTIGPPFNLQGDCLFTPDSQAILCWDVEARKELKDPDVALRKFDIPTGKLLGTHDMGAGGPLQLTSDGRHLISIWSEGIASYDLVDERGGVETFPKDLQEIRCITLSSRESLLLFAGGPGRLDLKRHSGTVGIQNRTSKAVTRIYTGKLGTSFGCCAIAPDEVHFAVGTNAYREEVTDPFQGRVLLFKKK
jgi:WD40 repeat protein